MAAVVVVVVSFSYELVTHRFCLRKNYPDIISTFRIVAMLVIVHLQTTLRYTDIITGYFHAKFHIPSSDSLVIDINLKAKFHAAAILFYIPENNYLNRRCTFSRRSITIPYLRSLRFSISSLALRSELCTCALLLLMIRGK
jgi:hypothetical protein